MTQDEKDLLLRDLCTRLPYGVKIYLEDAPNTTLIGVVDGGLVLHNNENDYTYNIHWKVEYTKPYLFPLSSMTEEQQEELITITNGKFRYMCGGITNAIPRKNTSEWGISENAFINAIGEEDGWDEFSQYQAGDNTYDLTGENDHEKVVKVYKLLKDGDKVVVKKDGNTIQLSDNEAGTEYVIDLGNEGEKPEAEVVGGNVINVLYIWLLKNHFDINGLIPMGLANDATGLDIY